MPGEKYKAFISYSHKDQKWADWLHKAVETYPIPKRLVGQETDHGPIRKRLTPIFRDREELPTATDLGKVVNAALAQSACLIVICSPDAARSRWVNEEILAFKRLGNDRIFSLIVDGEPNAANHPEYGLDECFPEALCFKLGPDGNLTDEPSEPIAADARPGKDGKANAKLKLISGILGVGFDALRQREQQRRHRRMVAISAASLAGMVIAFGLAAAAWIARAEAERQMETARQTTNFLVDLFKVSDPGESRGQEITANELLEKGANRIREELADQPAIQATLMDTMGSVYTNLGNYKRATVFLRDALATRRALHTGDHIEVAQSLNRLGQVLKLNADYEEAETILRQSLATRRATLGEEHTDVAQSINELADVLTRAGKFEEAEPLFRAALTMRQKLLGEQHPDVAQSLEDLALNLFDQGDYESPAPLLREAVAIRTVVQGDPHPDLAEAINNLGYVLGELGEYEEAEALYREALAMKRKLFSDANSEIAISLNNIAYVLHDQGKYEEAEATYREVLAIQREALSGNHPDIAMTLNNLAYLLYDRGDLTAALAMSYESLEVYRRAVGDEHPAIAWAMNNRAMWLMEDENYEAAEPLLRSSLALRQKLLGDEHPDIAGSMTLIASLLVATNRYEEALEYARKARAISTVALSNEHWRTAIAISAEGAALVGLEKYVEAETLLLQSYAMLSTDEGALPVFVTETTQRLARLYEDWGRAEEAEKYLAIIDFESGLE